MPPVVLASEVMDISAGVLNDTALTNYTYTAQLPYLKMANAALEKILMIFDSEVQRQESTAITVAIGATTLTLPSDFLLPISLFERAPGQGDDLWILMTEMSWEPNVVQTNTLEYWAFRNNIVQLVGSLTTREVLLKYERMMAVISGSASPTDTYLAKEYLGFKTAELCARFIGMNSLMANEIRDNQVFPAEDMLTRVLTQNKQSQRYRRQKYSARR